MDPVVEKSESVRETQDCNEIVGNDQRLAVEQNMEIHAQGDDKKLGAEDVGERIGREMGFGDYCFGRLLGSDREVQPYWRAEETGKLEWTYEDFRLGSGNARFEEIGSFTRYYASST